MQVGSRWRVATTGAELGAGLRGARRALVRVGAGDRFTDAELGTLDRCGAVLSLLAPTATPRRPTPVAGYQLGSAYGNARHACDFTGNGKLDIVAVTCRATVGGVPQTGAAYVWSGGAALLTGTPAPTSILTVPGAVAGDALGGWFGVPFP